MIYRLHHLIPHSAVETQITTGQWVRAMPEPFRGGLIDRCRDAWSIITEQAVAVSWPKDGEFEQATALAEKTGDVNVKLWNIPGGAGSGGENRETNN
jgi:hypothetical protein